MLYLTTFTHMFLVLFLLGAWQLWKKYDTANAIRIVSGNLEL
jgi:hypothetical protein